LLFFTIAFAFVVVAAVAAAANVIVIENWFCRRYLIIKQLKLRQHFNLKYFNVIDLELLLSMIQKLLDVSEHENRNNNNNNKIEIKYLKNK